MLTGIVSSVAAAIVPFVVFHSNFLPVKSLFWKLVLESGMFMACYLMVVLATNRNTAFDFIVKNIVYDHIDCCVISVYNIVSGRNTNETKGVG